MDFLDKLVLPQSFEHIQLLHYITMLVMFLFIPFISIFFAGTVLSIYYKRKGLKENNLNYIRFSKEIIELTTVNKSVGLILGIVPLLILILIFSQLFHTIQNGIINYLIYSLVFLIISFILIYTYRYSLSFSEIFSLFNKQKINEVQKSFLIDDIEKYSHNFENINKSSGTWGIILLLIATYFYTAATTLVISTNNWDITNSFWGIFSSANILSDWIQFLIGSFAITGAFILFVYFYWEGGRKKLEEDYLVLIKNISLKIILISSLILPLFIVINLLSIPSDSLTFSVFGFSTFSLLLIFVIYHFIYDAIKNSSLKYSGWIFFFILIAFFCLIVADQSALSNTTKKHSLILASDYEKYLKELEGETGGIAEVSGKEIFDTKCSACHKFDQKLVGPPYKETLPKYEGKENDLVNFILNPSKKNPAYPPMPAQGLKPNEAKAIATYILEEYKKY